jgi:hypothetical protein
MGTEAAASAADLLRSRIPFQTDGELVLPKRGVGLVLVDLCNGFCTVGAGNLVSRRRNLSSPAAPFFSFFLLRLTLPCRILYLSFIGYKLS